MHVLLEWELAVDTLREWIDFGVPAEGDRREILPDLLCPDDIENSCFYGKGLFSLERDR